MSGWTRAGFAQVLSTCIGVVKCGTEATPSVKPPACEFWGSLPNLDAIITGEPKLTSQDLGRS